ncbi:MAG: tetratricopeptide repeat protein, partial [Blastocatellia bacterium]
LGMHAEAVGFIRRSVDMFAPYPVEQAFALSQFGREYLLVGFPELAREALEAGTKLWPSSGNGRSQAVAFYALGFALVQLGRYRDALRAYTRAHDIFQTSTNFRDPVQLAASENGLGTVYSYLGDYEEARQHYEKAIPCLPREAQQDVILNLVGIYFRLGKPAAAEGIVREMQKETVSNPALEARLCSTLGTILLFSDRVTEAIPELERAKQLMETHPRQLTYITALVNLGRCYDLTGRKDNARELYRKVEGIATELHDKATLLNVEYDLARLELSVNQLSAAEKEIEAAKVLADAQLTQAANYSQGLSYSASLQQTYQLYIRIKMALYDQVRMDNLVADCLGAIESIRARNLIEMIGRSKDEDVFGLPPELTQKETGLEAKLRAENEQLIALLSRSHEQVDESKKRVEIQDLQKQIHAIQVQKIEDSALFAATRYPIADLATIRSLLDDNTLLLEYDLDDPKSYLFVVSDHPEYTLVFELPSRKDIESRAVDAYNTILAGGESLAAKTTIGERTYQVALVKLTNAVLRPAGAILGTKRLVIVPDGALYGVPFAALSDPEQEVDVQPSK